MTGPAITASLFTAPLFTGIRQFVAISMEAERNSDYLFFEEGQAYSRDFHLYNERSYLKSETVSYHEYARSISLRTTFTLSLIHI